MTRECIACDERALDRTECRDAIARCLRGLPPTQREIVFLRYGEDRTQFEIGARCRPAQMQVSALGLVAILSQRGRGRSGGVAGAELAG
jgi:DNA-directed RNA polymerase specialized sigma subunit